MGLLGAAIGGVVGGAIGAAVWAAIVYFSGYEVGFVAWGIGVLVGIGVRVGSGQHTGIANGILAVCIAVSAIAIGKYSAVHFLVNDKMAEIEKLVDGQLAAMHVDEEVWEFVIADQLIEELEAKGEKIQWPGGTRPASLDDVDEEAEYPVEVLKDARARWANMSGEEKESYKVAIEGTWKDEMRSGVRVEADAIRDQAFAESWGLLDIVFVLLAVASAFKLATGAETSD
jgi:hypothetical protein